MSSVATIRRRAKRLGYYVSKPRQSKYVPQADNPAYYMVIDANRRVVLGERFDARLEDSDEFLNGKMGVVVVPPIAVGAR